MLGLGGDNPTGWPTKPAENWNTTLGYGLSLLNSQYEIIK